MCHYCEKIGTIEFAERFFCFDCYKTFIRPILKTCDNEQVDALMNLIRPKRGQVRYSAS